MILAAAPASAADLRCGATIRSAVTLAADLGGCAGTGLRLTNGASLDCAGHTVAGSGGGEGIVVDRAVGAVVRNCRVTGFRTGIRVRGGRDNVVAESEALGNGHYGIELAVAARGTRIESTLVADSGDEGIHVGTAADGTEIVGSEIRDSKRENVYLLSVRDCSIVGNRIAGAGSAAIYAKHTTGCAIADNAIERRPVQVRGDSSGNLFSGNDLRGAGYAFEAYRDSRGVTSPRDNAVEGGSVAGASTCFRFAGARDNRVSGVAVADCRPVSLTRSAGLAATGNQVEYTRLAGDR